MLQYNAVPWDNIGNKGGSNLRSKSRGQRKRVIRPPRDMDPIYPFDHENANKRKSKKK